MRVAAQAHGSLSKLCAERAALGLNDALCLSAEQSNWVSTHRFTDTPWLVSEHNNSPWFNPDAQQLTWSDTGLTLLEGQSSGSATPSYCNEWYLADGHQVEACSI